MGIALTSWNYMWRTTPMHRSEEAGSADDLPPGLPQATVDDDVQRIEDGVGPLFHRLQSFAWQGGVNSSIQSLKSDTYNFRPV